MNNKLIYDLGHSGVGYGRQSVPPSSKVTGSVQAGTSSSSTPSSSIASMPFLRPSSPTASRNTNETKRPLTFLNTDDFFIMKASSECKYCTCCRSYILPQKPVSFLYTLLLTSNNNFTDF